MKKYTADFETNVSVEKTRVWAVGLVDIETKEFFHGNAGTIILFECDPEREKSVFPIPWAGI